MSSNLATTGRHSTNRATNTNSAVEDIIPLTPPSRPPFSRYISATSTLPGTPQTPYPPLPSPSLKHHDDCSPLQAHLGLPSRVILTIFALPLILLLVTTIHLISSASATQALADSYRAQLLSSCNGIQTGFSSLYSLPRYLALQSNAELVKAVQASILGLGVVLAISITIMETVINFMIDIYRSLLMCTIELAVRGTLEVVIGAVRVISDGVTDSLNIARTAIQDDVGKANTLIQAAVSGINRVTSLVNVNLAVPQFTIPSLSGLQNVKISTDFQDSLVSLNASLPTLSELKDKIQDIVSIPFEALKREINETTHELAAGFNSSLLPVPTLESIQAAEAGQPDYCTSLDTSIIDDTAKSIKHLSNIAIGLMFLVIFLVWLTLAIWEWWKFRMMRSQVEAVEQEWQRSGKAGDGWKMVAIVEHPILERYATGAVQRLASSDRGRRNWRWFMAYVSHPALLTLFFVSLLSLLCLQLQLIAVNNLRKDTMSTANQSVEASTQSLVGAMSGSAQNSSMAYAAQVNEVIIAYQDKVNAMLFGHWVNTTTVVLNETLVEFYDGVEQVLNFTFGKTILAGPVNNFAYCILGSKIDTLGKGLTWIHDNARITLPLMKNDTLVMSDEAYGEVASPVSGALVGSSSGGDNGDGLIGRLIDRYKDTLVRERDLYAILLGVWAAAVLVGAIIAVWHTGINDRYALWRRAGIDHRSGRNSPWPFKKQRQEPHPIYDEHSHDRNVIPTVAISRPSDADQDHGRPSSPLFGMPSMSKHSQHTNENSDSFLDCQETTRDRRDANGHPIRPFTTRSVASSRSLAALAAPGVAWLKKGKDNIGKDDGHTKLVEKGESSERYSHGEDAESVTQTSTWSSKLFGVTTAFKAFLPGSAVSGKTGVNLSRNMSQRTEKSWGDSQPFTPRSPWTKRGDWVDSRSQHRFSDANEDKPAADKHWSIVTPAHLRIREQTDSRYPALSPSQNTGGTTLYPRPLPTAPSSETLPSRYNTYTPEGSDRGTPDTPVSPGTAESFFSGPLPKLQPQNDNKQGGTAVLAAFFKEMEEHDRKKKETGPVARTSHGNGAR